MRLKAIFIFSLLIVAKISLLAQDISSENQQVIENIIEEIANNTDEELDYTILYDDLYSFFTNPLNLNTATEEDLAKLQFLNDFQIKSIINYRIENGAFLSIYELQLLYGFTTEIIGYLIPFIKTGPADSFEKLSLKKALKYGKHEIFTRYQQIIEKQEGFKPIDDSSLIANPNLRYLGTPAKIYNKYSYNYSEKLSWGLTMEKDPGEEFFKGNEKKGFDYYSGFLQLSKLKHVDKFVLGDYKLEFGQGLCLWSGIGAGKSSYVLNTKRTASGLSRYASADENKFFRGAATTFHLKHTSATLFYSQKPVDANIDSVNEEEAVYSVTSLQYSGYHTTPAEIFDKDAVKETIFGGNFNYTHKRLKAGLTYVNYALNALVSKDITYANRYDKYLGKNQNLGLNYQYYHKNFDFFGEVAFTGDTRYAIINGVLISLTNQVFLSAVYRNYNPEYFSYYGSGFGENSKPNNEKGLYYGLEVYPYKHWKLSVYFDNYTFPYLKTNANAPSKGTDLFGQAEFNPNRNINMYLRFKTESKQVNADIENQSQIAPLILQSNQKLRYHVSYRINHQLQLKNRVEFARFKEDGTEPETGYLIYQDIKYNFRKIPMGVSARYALFDTETYNARIYSYESDVLYAFSVPAYYYQGSRSYITIKYHLFRGCDLWLRWAQTYLSNRDHHGSGLTEISGRTKSEVKVQLRYKF